MEDDTGGEDTSEYSSLSDELKNIQNHIKLTRNINGLDLKIGHKLITQFIYNAFSLRYYCCKDK